MRRLLAKRVPPISMTKFYARESSMIEEMVEEKRRV